MIYCKSAHRISEKPFEINGSSQRGSAIYIPRFISISVIYSIQQPQTAQKSVFLSVPADSQQISSKGGPFLKSSLNTVSFLVYGARAIFTDPVTKTNGERHTYPVPTYDALRGVLESCYWKPTLRWVIDRVRIMNPITKETVSIRLPKYSSDKADRSYNTYLTDVAYQVEAHFEWSDTPGYEQDRDYKKHLTMARRFITRGGRYDIYLGSRECQAYIEPCVFGEGAGAYDDTPLMTFGLMYHGYTYPNMCGEDKIYARFWDAYMEHGVMTFPAPEACPIRRFIRSTVSHAVENVQAAREEASAAKPFTRTDNFSSPSAEDKRSWSAKLCQTYDNLYRADREGERAGTIGILSPGHIIKNAQYELTLDGDGNLIPDSIRVLPDDEAATVIPCSMTSQFRTGRKKDPHLLLDELEYLAGDYPQFISNSGDAHTLYMKQLGRWCKSSASHPLAEIIYAYLQKDTLMHDLASAGVLPSSITAQAPVVAEKWPKDAGNAYVRFKIRIEGLEEDIWNNRSLWDSACAFNRLEAEKAPHDICYVTGEHAYPTQLHPYLRGTTKLISANDKEDFTYRYGLLHEPQHCLQISYEASQKIHLALRWLLAHRSFYVGDRTYLLWSMHNVALPQLLSAGPGISREESPDPETAYTAFRDMIHGFTAVEGRELPPGDEVVLMSIASPTTGRISVTGYETMPSEVFFSALRHWYASTAARMPVKGGWELRAPTPHEVADAAAGASQTSQERLRIVRRVLESMVLGKPLPRDLVHTMISSVSMQISLGAASGKCYIGDYKPLNITCGIVRKYLNDLAPEDSEEVWTMSLHSESQDRGYLLGRLLAYYYKAENLAQYISGNGFRTTNAERLMRQYQVRPATVLRMLEQRLLPYRKRLMAVNSGRVLLARMDQLMASLTPDILSDQPLTESFILGYHAQLEEFRETSRRRKAEHTEAAAANQ